MKSVLPFVLGVVVGTAVGAGSLHFYHRALDREFREEFDRRAQCKKLGDVYAREQQSEGTVLWRVDFSSSRNSCIASTITIDQNKVQVHNIVDLLTHESLWDAWCSEIVGVSNYCGSGEHLRKAMDDAFDKMLRAAPTH